MDRGREDSSSLSSVSFAVKELSRRRLTTLLIILGLAISVASTVFLVLLGGHLGFEVESITGEQSALGFSFIFSRFIVFVVVLNVLIGVLVVFFLFSLAMSQRIQDVGIMKAFGCLTSSVFSIFATELSLLILSGCILGTVAGLAAYLGIFTIVDPSFISNINWLSIFLVFLGFFVLSHLFGARPIVRAIQMKPAYALSPSHLFSATTEFSGKSLSRLGLTFRVAFRSLMRRALPTRSIFLCLTMILALVTVTVVGGFVASETTANYLDRAVGRDVVLVAHKDLVEQYATALRQFHKTESIAAIDYLSQEYSMPEPFILQLSSVPNVANSEKRLFYETVFYEGYGVIFNPIDTGVYYYVGEGRSGSTFVMGIDPSSVFSNWLIDGEPLTATKDCALIGNSLAAEMFVSPLDQEIVVSNKNYKIVGICVDPFNNGNVTYVPFDMLPSSLKEFGYNLLFLKIDSENRSQALMELDKLLTGTDYRLLELNTVLEENIDFLENNWSLVMTVPFASLATAVFCLFTYLIFSITVQQQEFGIMRAVGAKPKMVTSIAVTQVLIILFSSALSGVTIGLLLTYLFIVPEPVISLSTIYSIFGLLAFTIAFLGLSSLYPTLKTVKKPVRDSLHSL